MKVACIVQIAVVLSTSDWLDLAERCRTCNSPDGCDRRHALIGQQGADLIELILEKGPIGFLHWRNNPMTSAALYDMDNKWPESFKSSYTKHAKYWDIFYNKQTPIKGMRYPWPMVESNRYMRPFHLHPKQMLQLLKSQKVNIIWKVTRDYFNNLYTFLSENHGKHVSEFKSDMCRNVFGLLNRRSRGFHDTRGLQNFFDESSLYDYEPAEESLSRRKRTHITNQGEIQDICYKMPGYVDVAQYCLQAPILDSVVVSYLTSTSVLYRLGNLCYQ